MPQDRGPIPSGFRGHSRLLLLEYAARRPYPPQTWLLGKIASRRQATGPSGSRQASGTELARPASRGPQSAYARELLLLWFAKTSDEVRNGRFWWNRREYDVQIGGVHALASAFFRKRIAHRSNIEQREFTL